MCSKRGNDLLPSTRRKGPDFYLTKCDKNGKFKVIEKRITFKKIDLVMFLRIMRKRIFLIGTQKSLRTNRKLI